MKLLPQDKETLLSLLALKHAQTPVLTKEQHEESGCLIRLMKFAEEIEVEEPPMSAKLKAFIEAGYIYFAELENAHEILNYPSYLPSFDEFIEDMKKTREIF